MFETSRLRLRPWRPEDRADLDPILGDAEVMRFSDTGVLDPAAQEAWLKHAMPRGWPGILAVEEKASNAIVGYAGLTQDPKRTEAGEVELGFRFARAAWGQGFATEAACGLVDVARDAPSVRRIIAIVDPNNLRSVAVLRRIGMTYAREIMFEGYQYPDHLYTRAAWPAPLD